MFKINRYDNINHMLSISLPHPVRSSGLHSKVSPATLPLRTLKCSSRTAPNMMAINSEHLLSIYNIGQFLNSRPSPDSVTHTKPLLDVLPTVAPPSHSCRHPVFRICPVLTGAFPIKK